MEHLEVHEICFPKLMAGLNRASVEFRQRWCHWSWHTAPLPFYWAGQWTVLGTSAGPFHCPQFNFYLGGNFLDQYSPQIWTWILTFWNVYIYNMFPPYFQLFIWIQAEMLRRKTSKYRVHCNAPPLKYISHLFQFQNASPLFCIIYHSHSTIQSSQRRFFWRKIL